MGRSVTCTYQVGLFDTDEVEAITGAMSLKQAKNILASEIQWRKESNGHPIQWANVWAQTAAGRKTIQRNYIRIYPDNRIEHRSVTDSADEA